MSLVSVVCCQVEIYMSGLSLAYRSPTECGVSECDREASITRRTWPTRAVEPWKKTNYVKIMIVFWVAG
jgi:hypothetical protein